MGRITFGVKAAAGAATALFGYAVAVEPYMVAVEKIEILCPRLPAAFDGYTILQVSDLHMRGFGRREHSIAGLIAGMDRPDLIAVTGDLVHSTAGVEPFMRFAETLKARDGVYAVFGNSEHKNGVDPAAFLTRLSSGGIVSLSNSHVTISRGASQFQLCGVDDPASGHDDLERAMRMIADDDFVLLLMHSPDPIGLAAARGVDVVLSGHTHGGQVRLPIYGPPLTHSWHGRRMDSGLYSGIRLQKIIGFRPGRTRLYVTRGLGTSGLSLRFLCPPELSLITLRAIG